MNEEKLKQLLERYYSGSSTREEEELLKDYFNGNDIIPGYDEEKEIFSHYSAMDVYPDPSDDLEERIQKTIANIGQHRIRKIIRMPLPALISIAAMILLLIGSYYMFILKAEPRDTYSDPKIAYVETMRILNDISAKINKRTMELKPIARLSIVTRTSLESIDRSTTIFAAGLQELQVFDKLSATDNNSNKIINDK